MLGFSAGEIIVIALIALLLFGNKDLPQNLRKFFNEFSKLKKVVSNAQNSWHEVKNDIQRQVILDGKTPHPESKPYSLPLSAEARNEEKQEEKKPDTAS